MPRRLSSPVRRSPRPWRSSAPSLQRDQPGAVTMLVGCSGAWRCFDWVWRRRQRLFALGIQLFCCRHEVLGTWRVAVIPFDRGLWANLARNGLVSTARYAVRVSPRGVITPPPRRPAPFYHCFCQRLSRSSRGIRLRYQRSVAGDVINVPVLFDRLAASAHWVRLDKPGRGTPNGSSALAPATLPAQPAQLRARGPAQRPSLIASWVTTVIAFVASELVALGGAHRSSVREQCGSRALRWKWITSPGSPGALGPLIPVGAASCGRNDPPTPSWPMDRAAG